MAVRQFFKFLMVEQTLAYQRPKQVTRTGNKPLFVLALLLNFVGELAQTKLDLIAEKNRSRICPQSARPKDVVINTVVLKDQAHI